MVVEETVTEEEAINDVPLLDSVRGDRAQGDQAMLRYLRTVLAVITVLYLTPFFLARSPLYDRVNPSFYARPLNYAFQTAGENADVVIFGDSTALLGINPSQMSSVLGVKVLNLVNTQPSLVVNDDMSLRHYLRANRLPRVIIFYFAPWDLDYGHNDFDSRPTYEGEELLLRQGTSQEMLAFVRKHPRELILFPLKFYGTAWQFTLHHVPHPNQQSQLKATLGHVDNTDSTIMNSSCHFPQYLIDNVRFSWVHDLSQRYKSSGIQVLIYVAPLPACDNVSAVIERPYDQLPARPPRQAPPDFFTNDVRFIHPRSSAVPELTRDLTDAVRPVLSRKR